MGRDDGPSPRQRKSASALPNRTLVILTLYVDHVLLLGANKHLLNKLKKQLMDHFEMTDMGDVSRVLGMNVNVTAKKKQ